MRAIAREQGRSPADVERELLAKASGEKHDKQGSGSDGRSGGSHSGGASNADTVYYVLAATIFMLGMSYAAVPLYQAFCQATGYGGTVRISTEEKFKTMRPVAGARPVTVRFEATTSDNMPWEFTPQQRTVRVVPGETALAFYTAFNPTDRPITGVSTYNVTPMRVGVHFNKIQCFCFEEQRLRPNEEIDMPLFFYIDPDFCDDPSMEDVREVTLSYTFFRTGNLEAEEAGVGTDKAVGPRIKSEARTHGAGPEEGNAAVEVWTSATAAKLGMKLPERA